MNNKKQDFCIVLLFLSELDKGWTWLTVLSDWRPQPVSRLNFLSNIRLAKTL